MLLNIIESNLTVLSNEHIFIITNIFKLQHLMCILLESFNFGNEAAIIGIHGEGGEGCVLIWS
jgi:hypothetical protein